MSFAAPKQLLSPQAGGIPAGDAAIMLWETAADESMARQETWLLSFIDILALLLTLFVLLLAYQGQDPGKEKAGTGSGPVTSLVVPFDFPLFALQSGGALYDSFGHSGAGLLPLEVDAGYPVTIDVNDAVSEEPGSAGIVSAESAISELPEIVSDASVAPVSESELVGQDILASAALPLVDAEQHTVPLPELEGPPLPSPTEAIQQAFARSHLPQSVDVLSRPGAVSIEISDNILFEPASAALSTAGQRLLNEVAMVLAELTYPLSVEGHTDNVPISSSRFPSNWELSSARAAMATRALIEQGIAADRLRAIGYGDTRPRADNVSAEGRARNRRVSFVLQVDEAGL